MTFLIYGSNGYVGSALVNECVKRGVRWRPGDRSRVEEEVSMLCDGWGVINAAAFITNPTVDACKDHPNETIAGNVVLPAQLAIVCKSRDIPFMQLSTGCLYDERREYSEDDAPTRGWGGYCGFYVGTKLLSERLVREYDKHYILRLRLPFDEVDHPRNYLTKLTKFDKVFEHMNSLTHRGDFAKWALDLWEKRAPFGTYHCVNTEQVTATAVTMSLALNGLIPKLPTFVQSPDTTGARLSNSKLASAIGPVRSVHEAVAEAIEKWRKA